MQSHPWSLTVQHPSWGLGILVVAALLALFGAGIAAAVFLRGRRLRRHHVRQLASIAVTWFWMIPLVAVVALVGLKAVYQMRVVATDTRVAVVNAEAAPAEAGQVITAPGHPFLKARQMSSDEPNWVTQPVPGAADGTFLTLSSQRFALLEEAERQVTGQVIEAIRHHFYEEFPDYGNWEVPVALVEQYAVQQSAYEVIDKDFGGGFKNKMYRVHVQLKFSPDLRQALYGSWRAGVVDHRLLILGSLFGLVTLICGTIAGYIRLDDVSFGMYRRRLKFAAGALITAGSLVAARLVG